MKTRMVWIAMAVSVFGAAEEPSRRVIVHVQYDGSVPSAVVLSAERRARERFASIGVPVHFLPGRKGKSNRPGELDLEMRIQAQAPAGASGSALAHAHPYDNGASILVFYSPIDAYSPSEYRDALLGYVFAHEIGHALQGIVRHSESGVMKASWTRADFDQMHHDGLPFHSTDAELIRLGLAKASAPATH